MAYADDIDALSPDHAYSLDGDLLDRISTAHGTASGATLVGAAVCEDVTNALLTDATAERVSFPSVTTINNAAHTRKAVGGWFSATAIQNPPKFIYYEGDDSLGVKIVLGWGNNLMFEIDNAGTDVFQIFGDTVLEAGREYHLFIAFEGNGFGNTFRAYLDGVDQVQANPSDRQPDFASLTARGVANFGDPSGATAVGGSTIALLSPINGNWNEWAHWTNKTLPTPTEIREELFEKGALPDVTITNQAGLDALADTVRPNAPLCIRVTGSGTIDLTADNVTFDPLASIHVQYTGTGTVNWTNTNGSNASIGSTTLGGTLNFINPATLTIEGLINGAEVRIYDDEIPSDNFFNTELDGIESLSGTSFTYDHNGTTNDILIQMIADGYEEVLISHTLSASDQLLTVVPVVEENT